MFLLLEAPAICRPKGLSNPNVDQSVADATSRDTVIGRSLDRPMSPVRYRVGHFLSMSILMLEVS